jgi:pimeloyl-ACP methyl ester carboxylesterase
MLHGIGADGLSYSRLMQLLQPKFRRIVSLESLGHGNSDTPSDVSFTEVLESLSDAIEELAFTEPPILLGNSMGGGMALWYATEFPAKVAGLVLASPAGAPLPPQVLIALVDSLSIQTLSDGWQFLQRLLYQSNGLIWPIAPIVRARFSRPAVLSLLSRVADAPTMTRDKLAGLSMPIYMVWGRGDEILPAECTDFYRENLPGHAIFRFMDGVGHSPQLEAPARLAQYVYACADAISGAS